MVYATSEVTGAEWLRNLGGCRGGMAMHPRRLTERRTPAGKLSSSPRSNLRLGVTSLLFTLCCGIYMLTALLLLLLRGRNHNIIREQIDNLEMHKIAP